MNFIDIVACYQLKTWKAAMKEADFNKDGKLSYLEFQDAVKLAEKKLLEAGVV